MEISIPMDTEVIIKNCVIIPFGEYAVSTGVNAHLRFEENLVLTGRPKFFRSPLLFIAYKILRREYSKQIPASHF